MLDEAGLAKGLAHHHGEAVRHGSRERDRAQRRTAQGLRRGPDLPDRPFPRQGAGAEHPGLPVRQRPVRADLEPQLHRPRPDRRAGDARYRHPRRLLRADRRLSRHGRHPSLPDPRLHRDGAADLARARSDQRGKEQGVPLALCRSIRPTWCAASTSATGRRRGSIRNRHGNLHRAQMQHRQLALGGRAVLPQNGQAHGRGPAHHLDRLPRAAAQHVPRGFRHRLGRVPIISPSTSPTSRKCPCPSTARSRGRACGSRSRACSSPCTRPASAATCSKPTSASSSTPCAATTLSSALPTASSGCGRFRPGFLDNPPPVRIYAPGSWGPQSIYQLVAPHSWRLPFERGWRDPNLAGA